MQGFPSSPFDSGETFELMRIEQARAARYGYPITWLWIEIDRLTALRDLHGVESERRTLRAVVETVRGAIRASDALVTMRGPRLLVLLPHVSAQGASAVAVRLLSACRALQFRDGSRSVRPTISIGAATLAPGESSTFEASLASAEEALMFALRSGGDRFVLHQTAGATIDELRRALEREEALLRALPFDAAESAPGAAQDAVPHGEPPPDTAPTLAARIRALFRALGGHSAELADLERDVLQAASEGLEAPRERDAASVQRQIASVERRIQRLKQLLDATESELAALARRKGVDPGVASIFRTVQGLRPDQEDFARRHEILTLIFEANVELRRGRGDRA